MAPLFSEVSGNPIGHEWAVEIQEEIPREPEAVEFAKTLDKHLMNLNSDYSAKRTNDLVLQLPKVNFMPVGTFEGWLDSRGKLGGQHKIPRLF